MDLRPTRNNTTPANRASGLMQRTPKHRQKDNRRNNRLEAKKVLHLMIGDAQEGDLQEEVDEEADHAFCVDTLRFEADVVGDVCVVRGHGGEEDDHALSACCSLDTAITSVLSIERDSMS